MEFSLAPIRTMQPLIVERLRLAFPERRFQIRRVPSVLTVKEFDRVVRMTPFLGLAWMGVQPGKANGRQLQAVWQWRLMLIFKATGSDDRRFAGDAMDIGLDAMTDVAMAILQGAQFPDIGHASVTRAEAVYAEGWEDDATVVSQVDFEISATSELAPFKLLTPGDFERLGINWSTPGAGDPPIVEAKEETIVLNEEADA